MANIFFYTAIALWLATGAEAQPKTPHSRLTAVVTRVDFVFDNAVRKTNDLPTAALKATRRQMIAGAYVGPTALRALADAGDGLAAFRYAKLLQDKNSPDPTGAAAHYFSIAAYTGRAFAVPPLARLLKDRGASYSASRLTQGLNAMTVQALSGNAVAATLLGQMYADGVPFGKDLAQAQTYFDMASGGGSPRAVLQLGIALMSDPADKALGHPGARSALNLAATGADLSVRVTAENLLRLIDKPSSPQPEVTK